MTHSFSTATERSDVPSVVRDYVTDVTWRLDVATHVLYSNFDQPRAYLLTPTKLITWDPALGWARGPHTNPDPEGEDVLVFHEPGANPWEVAYSITHGQARDIIAWYADEVPQWDRAAELPTQFSTETCAHGLGAIRTFVDCEGCETDRQTVRAALSSITAGLPADLIA